MRDSIFFKSFLLLVSVVFLVSCDKDYNEVGDALIGENHFDLTKGVFSVTAYNEKTGPIQSNNLPVNALGIYDNPAFGKTTASFVSEVVLATENPVIGANAQIDSVYINVPYFVDAKQTKPKDTGGNSYVLDSIYGDSKAKIKLSLYESGRYIGKQTGVPQIFYTDDSSEFDGKKIGNRLNNHNSDLTQNDAFFFNPAQHVLTTKDDAGKETKTYSAPAMRLKLDNTFFQTKILNAPADKLVTNNNFREYFKGLYFKVEQSGTDPGSLAMIDFSKGTVTINYKEDLVASTIVNGVTTSVTTRVAKSIVINMTINNPTNPINTVNLLEQSNEKASYTNAVNSPDRTNGDEKLYLKGGEGSLAVLELFDKTDLIGYDVNGVLISGPNGVSDELDAIRKNKWLINQANLVFNIDASTMANSYEPERLYLYDFTNSTTVLDYYLSVTTANKENSKYSFGGYIKKDSETKRGNSYKINITYHLRNLIKNSDVENIKLGVVVTENINIADFYKVRTPTDFITNAPAASVMSPLGTVLYGSKTTDDAKKLKLEIYYTKPN